MLERLMSSAYLSPRLTREPFAVVAIDNGRVKARMLGAADTISLSPICEISRAVTMLMKELKQPNLLTEGH